MWDKMNRDGSDTTFKSTNGVTTYPFWVEYMNARDDYSIWVKVVDNAVSSFKWYFGDPNASGSSNGHDVFETFADEASDFKTGSQPTTEKGKMRLYDNLETSPAWLAASTYDSNQQFVMKVKAVQVAAQSTNAIHVNMNDSSMNRYAWDQMTTGSEYRYYVHPTMTQYWSSCPFEVDLVKKIVLRKSDSKVDYYIYQDGVLQASALNKAYAYGTPTSMFEIRLVGGSVLTYCDIRLDWLFVAKYNSSAPTLSSITYAEGCKMKINSITPGKINGISITNVSKIIGS